MSYLIFTPKEGVTHMASLWSDFSYMVPEIQAFIRDQQEAPVPDTTVEYVDAHLDILALPDGSPGDVKRLAGKVTLPAGHTLVPGGIATCISDYGLLADGVTSRANPTIVNTPCAADGVWGADFYIPSGYLWNEGETSSPASLQISFIDFENAVGLRTTSGKAVRITGAGFRGMALKSSGSIQSVTVDTASIVVSFTVSRATVPVPPPNPPPPPPPAPTPSGDKTEDGVLVSRLTHMHGQLYTANDDIRALAAYAQEMWRWGKGEAAEPVYPFRRNYTYTITYPKPGKPL